MVVEGTDILGKDRKGCNDRPSHYAYPLLLVSLINTLSLEVDLVLLFRNGSLNEVLSTWYYSEMGF